ncbi:MAG: helix-turn-helix domain-containing protein [Cytophagales bacterium]|nr:helix-turn-helix domain-containing protein [Cytophagales bacterium]
MENLVRVSFDIWSALLAFGVFQGLMMLLVLLGFKRNLALMSLVGLVFVVVLNLFNHLLLSTQLFLEFPHLVYVFTPTLLLLGPLYYWHICAATDPGRRPKSPWLHLIPFGMAIVMLVPFYALSGIEKVAQLELQQQEDLIPMSVTTYAFMILQIGQSFIYVILGNKQIMAFRKVAIGEKGRSGFKWLTRFGWAFAAFWLLDFIALTSYLIIGAIHQQVFYATMLGAAIFINVLVVFMIRSHKEFHDQVLNPKRSKPQNSTQSIDELEKVLTDVYQVMDQDKPYLDPELSLAKFSKFLEKTPHQVSEILNLRLGKSFYEFINEYRYQEARNRLQSDQYKHLTILAIAFDSGFNNKNTFNRVFKKYAGKTPSQFLKEN